MIASGLARACLRAARNAMGALGLVVALLAALASPARAANYTDIWWNAAESGWGLTLAHHDDKVFAVWYLYDESGRPQWVYMSNGVVSPDGRSVAGEVYRTSGPSYRDPAFSWERVRVTQVGTARLDFADDSSAAVTYSVGGKTIHKAVTRFGFGAAPANAPHDYGDLWWDPSESGWGLSLHHHGDNIFGIWYTYDLDQKPLWIVMPTGTFSGDTFTGALYTASGTPFDRPFVAADTRLTAVGSATIVFSADTARFTATVNGFTVTRTLSRIPFGTRSGNKPPKVSTT